MGEWRERMSKTEVSVVIPAFQAERFISEAIESVLSQTHPPSSVVVVDDGCTDKTAEIAEAFGPKVRVLRQQNLGPATAANAGLAVVRSPFVACLDADDRWLPTKLEEQLSTFEAHAELDVVFCKMRSFQDDGARKVVDDAKSGWSRSTMLARREVFDKVGPFAQQPNNRGETVDWISRARAAGCAMKLLDAFLAERRIHPESLSYRADANSARDFAAIARRALLRKQGRGPE